MKLVSIDCVRRQRSIRRYTSATKSLVILPVQALTFFITVIHGAAPAASEQDLPDGRHLAASVASVDGNTPPRSAGDAFVEVSLPSRAALILQFGRRNLHLQPKLVYG